MPTTCQILGTWMEWLVTILSMTVLVLSMMVDESIPPWIFFAIGIVNLGGQFLNFILGVLLPNKIFRNTANLQGQIPAHHILIYLNLFGYSFNYWYFMVI